MKILHAYCNAQHRSAVVSVLEELKRRGHEVKEIHLENTTLKPYKGQEDVSKWEYDVFLNSYPHIMQTAQGVSYENIRGVKVCIEHGVNPVAWAFPLDRHKLYDIICVAGKWQLDAVSRNESEWGTLKTKLRMTGWAKTDSLVGAGVEKGIARAALEQKMKQPFTADKPLIAFVPTHGGAWWRVDELRKLNLPNLVVAPHQGRYNAFKKRSKARSTEIDYSTEYPYYIETANVYEVLKAADVVISDYSSAALEALVLDLPVIQLLANIPLHHRDGMNPMVMKYYPLSQRDERKFILGANIADMKQLPVELEKTLSDKMYYAKERAFWKNEIFHDLGNATKNTCDVIENCSAKPA